MYFTSFFLLGACQSVYHLCLETDCAVGAYALACAARYALVVAVLVVDELKLGAEPLGPLVGLAVFGVSLGNLGGDEFLAGYSQAFDKACESVAEVREIFFNTTHSLLL